MIASRARIVKNDFGRIDHLRVRSWLLRAYHRLGVVRASSIGPYSRLERAMVDREWAPLQVPTLRTLSAPRRTVADDLYRDLAQCRRWKRPGHRAHDAAALLVFRRKIRWRRSRCGTHIVSPGAGRDSSSPPGPASRRRRRRIRDEGPLRSADMEGRSGSKGWWDLKLAKRVATALWSSGEFAIRERVAFQRTCDLAERVTPGTPSRGRGAPRGGARTPAPQGPAPGGDAARVVVRLRGSRPEPTESARRRRGGPRRPRPPRSERTSPYFRKGVLRSVKTASCVGRRITLQFRSQ